MTKEDVVVYQISVSFIHRREALNPSTPTFFQYFSKNSVQRVGIRSSQWRVISAFRNGNFLGMSTNRLYN